MKFQLKICILILVVILTVISADPILKRTDSHHHDDKTEIHPIHPDEHLDIDPHQHRDLISNPNPHYQNSRIGVGRIISDRLDNDDVRMLGKPHDRHHPNGDMKQRHNHRHPDGSPSWGTVHDPGFHYRPGQHRHPQSSHLHPPHFEPTPHHPNHPQPRPVSHHHTINPIDHLNNPHERINEIPIPEHIPTFRKPDIIDDHQRPRHAYALSPVNDKLFLKPATSIQRLITVHKDMKATGIDEHENQHLQKRYEEEFLDLDSDSDLDSHDFFADDHKHDGYQARHINPDHPEYPESEIKLEDHFQNSPQHTLGFRDSVKHRWDQFKRGVRSIPDKVKEKWKDSRETISDKIRPSDRPAKSDLGSGKADIDISKPSSRTAVDVGNYEKPEPDAGTIPTKVPDQAVVAPHA